MSEFSIGYELAHLDDGAYFIPAYARRRPACHAVLSGRHFEPETHALVARLMAWRPGSLVHAGTFFGDMLPSFARACPATVYAFEPVFENYVLARLCVFENDLAKVALVHAGLGARIGVARVETHNGATHRGGASRIAAEGQLTTILTVDSLGAGDLTLLQLDVEGHELPALEGASATIERCRPVIAVEDNLRACAPFLEARDYVLLGRTPGLRVWSPREVDPELREVLAGEAIGLSPA